MADALLCGVIDLPLSMMLDTALLPVTIPIELIRGPGSRKEQCIR